jgi:hypothetical protein
MPASPALENKIAATLQQAPRVLLDPTDGSHRKKNGVRPQTNNTHNKTIAEAAAKNFKKREKNIQDACANLDGDLEEKYSSCTIM